MISVSERRRAWGVLRAGLGLARMLCVLAAWPTSAAAQVPETEETRDAARKLAAEGTHAFERRDFERALELFEQASSLVQAPTIALMQARTLVELGRLAAAAERYEAAQSAGAAAPENPAFRQAADDAARELELLRPRIPVLRVKLVGSEASGARVSLDGQELPSEEAGEERWVDPGSHRVEVETVAGTSSSRTITLSEGAREELVFSLEPVVRVPVTAPPVALGPRPEKAEEREVRVTGWVALGSGITFAGAGAVLGILALGHKSDLDDVCTKQLGCPAEYEDDIGTYRLQRNLSYVGFALGAGGIGVGTYLLVRTAPGESATAINLSPTSVSISRSFQ